MTLTTLLPYLLATLVCNTQEWMLLLRHRIRGKKIFSIDIHGMFLQQHKMLTLEQNASLLSNLS